MTPLPTFFYQRDDVVQIARELIGKALFTSEKGKNSITGGIIVETEAYRGAEDKASHAYNNRRTPRTRMLFEEGGVAYVYLCYGMHYLLNVVTNQKDIPHAVLIRALFSTHGLKLIAKRRGKTIEDPHLTSGPGTLSQALGITKEHHGLPFHSPCLWLEETGIAISKTLVACGPRIGIAYAKEHALLPWRFYLQEFPPSLRIDIDTWVCAHNNFVKE
ncbi:MAG TPA: DNA-3-methyladenine glycosylase [Rhabdochlamydiaceae bacterium]|jgi:DNA-3-methyladenine glycosylase